MNDFKESFLTFFLLFIGIFTIYLIISKINIMDNKIKNIQEKSNFIETNKNMPYVLSTENMSFHISNFDNNQHELQFKEGVAIFPDKGIIILKMPENVKIIVEKEGMK